MDYRLTPAGEGEAELTVKRSRFIGRVRHVETEKEALSFIKEIRSLNRDASHNVCAYMLDRGIIKRFSDDGEPAGTAGSRILKSFSDKQIEDFCCVVTRFFGGILLGAGGLSRAYSSAAKLALDAAGICKTSVFSCLTVYCPYDLHDRIKRLLTDLGCLTENTEFGAEVVIKALAEPETINETIRRLAEESSGRLKVDAPEKQFKKIPL
ncbi:MAG: YigZ family protein [Oscillospiraceae bacterium]|nr:YigZ family protein [Oscillospiraceae bacterium]